MQLALDLSSLLKVLWLCEQETLVWLRRGYWLVPTGLGAVRVPCLKLLPCCFKSGMCMGLEAEGCCDPSFLAKIKRKFKG